MANLKKYDLTGAAKGEVSIEDTLLNVDANSQMLKDYLVAIRANARQWSASTQTRAEVNKTKRKPFAQKGTGNARQGFLGAPQFKGGGRVHAPRPKFDQHVRINKKEKRLAIRGLLSEKITASQAYVLETTNLKAPETKAVASFLKKLEISGRRVLFLAENSGAVSEQFKILNKSLRNIPKVSFTYLSNVSGEDLALCQELVILESAVENLKNALDGNREGK